MTTSVVTTHTCDRCAATSGAIEEINSYDIRLEQGVELSIKATPGYIDFEKRMRLELCAACKDKLSCLLASAVKGFFRNDL